MHGVSEASAMAKAPRAYPQVADRRVMPRMTCCCCGVRRSLHL